MGIRPPIGQRYSAALPRGFPRLLKMVPEQVSRVLLSSSQFGAPNASRHRHKRHVARLRSFLASFAIAVSALVLIQPGQVAYGEATQDEPAANSVIIEVSYNSGMFTLQASNAPLADVLQAIADQAGIEIVLAGDLSFPITRSYSDVALEDGLQRLMGDASYVMIYGSVPDGEDPAPLIELRVYADIMGTAGAISQSGAVSPEDAAIALRAVTLSLAPTAEGDEGLHEEIAGLERDERILAMQWLADFEDSIAVATLGRFLALDKDSAVRSEAAFALSGIGSDAAAEALAIGLGDDDPGVRLEVVDALSGIEDFDTALRLGQVLFGEPDPEVRLFAVVGLGEEHSEAAWILLEAAADDPDNKVSEAANSILAAWE